MGVATSAKQEVKCSASKRVEMRAYAPKVERYRVKLKLYDYQKNYGNAWVFERFDWYPKPRMFRPWSAWI